MARRPAIPISVGAVLLIGAVAGFVVVPEHRPPAPTDACAGFVGGPCPGAWRLSQTAFDLLRVSTWAVLSVGALLGAVGLINYSRR